MTTTKWIFLAAILAAGGRFASAQDFAGESGMSSDSKIILTIKADGSALLETETTQPRSQVEAMMRMMQMAQEHVGLFDQDDEATASQPPSKKEAKPMSDDELVKALRQAETNNPEGGDETPMYRIDSVVVTNNAVHITRSRPFDNLSEVVSNFRSVTGSMSTGLRLETDSEQHLRITLVRGARASRWARYMLKAWKAQGGKLLFKLALPGKVLSSDLFHTERNETWFFVDATDDASFNAYTKLMEKSPVITAETGGLKIEQPLDSKTVRHRRIAEKTSSMPITDAGPGFTAEAQSVSIVTTYYFPEGKKQQDNSDDNPVMMAMNSGSKSGLTVTASIFAPRGREVQSVSDIEILKAVDDKDREIKQVDEEQGGQSMDFTGGQGNQTSCPVQLQLDLPQPDAQSIQELSAQAVIVTTGSWKTMVVTNLTANSNSPVDISSILAGAKLIISKVTAKQQMTDIRLRIEGPPEIQQINVKYGTDEESNGAASETRFKKNGGQSMRELRLMNYGMNMGGTPASSPSLTLRFPQDQKRERFKFQLRGVDLF